ncbi:MAG: YceI family protein [Cyclobacteriaceae bacterium]|nr:YceI family protein [Cyclobacteriaceae bacterium]
MKTLLYIFVGLVIFWSGFPSEVKEENKWIVLQESEVSILGKTNINTFECQSFRYSGNDVLTEILFPEQKYAVWSGEVVLSSDSFDCFNRIMTKDFQETVRAEEHPEIRVRFLDLVRKNLGTPQESLTGNVEITLAGVCRRFPISCKLFKEENGKTLLKGSQEVTFQDFQIDPPVKFLGTVKVQNSISVNFDLILEKV